MHAILLGLILLQQPATDLDTLLQRASDYVAKYEEDLGNLIGSEDYVQNVAWMNGFSGSLGRVGTISKKQQRRTSGDFLIIQVGTQWSALRKVNVVDGLKVKEAAPSFDTAFDDSPASNLKRLYSMQADSTRYNIGDVIRQINLPTFALEVLRKSEMSRFTFEKAGTDKINGVLTWEVRFHEMMAPTLVVGGDGLPPKFLFSRGSLWIDPLTGRVLRTEFNLENAYDKPVIKAKIDVHYAQGKRVDMLVPTLMTEHYDNEVSTIDCRADYSNFRQFEVEVKFDLGPVKPGP